MNHTAPQTTRVLPHPNTSTAAATQADTELDLRWADCGGSQPYGWQLGWAQVVGCRHPDDSEDSLGQRSHPLPPAARPALDAPADPCGLWLALADGVGGGSYGEVASRALVDHCLALPAALLPHPDAMCQWLELAEAQVQLKLRAVSYAPGAATLVAAWLGAAAPNQPLPGYVLRVGDARAYLWDGGALEQLTTDQTYAHTGEAPCNGAGPDDPARMVGTGHMGQPELQALHLPPATTLVLCSDGLHRGLSPEAMQALLHQHGHDPQTCARQLAQAAREAGSDDDISVLLARREGQPPSKPRWLRWLVG